MLFKFFGQKPKHFLEWMKVWNVKNMCAAFDNNCSVENIVKITVSFLFLSLSVDCKMRGYLKLAVWGHTI